MRGAVLFLGGAAAGFLLAAFLGHDPTGIRTPGGGAGAAGVRASDAGRARETELREARAAIDRLESEVARLRAAQAEAAPSSPEAQPPAPAPGTRLPDGRIAGGARWTPETVTMAVGFLDTFLAQFITEAKLTPAQEARVRAEYQRSVREALQILADTINDDLTPDQAYERYAALTSQGLNALRQVLDGEQYAVFERFEKGTKAFVTENVISREVATLRQRLELDADQEKRVAAIVRERYAALDAALAYPIPNMFFKPLRREADRAVYDETARRIREALAPAQVETFDRLEADPMAPLRELRNQLVPR